MERKKVMLIVNPLAGRKWGEKFSDKVVNWFADGGALCTLFLTRQRGDGTRLVLENGSDFDVIACMGGDGTLNEVINGILKSQRQVPLGYIPAGSTNDFAGSMHLSKEPQQAVRDILAGHTQTIDAGQFNDKYFSYVASFGAFTKTSYATPQNMKNLLGRFSYFIEGAKDLGDIHAEHKVVEAGGRRFEGDYIFGAVSNSKCIGGLVKYQDSLVDISDEKLEMLLIKKPNDLASLCSVLHCLTHQIYDDPCIDFCHSDKFTIRSQETSDWSLDGEFAKGADELTISCVKQKLRFICPAQ